MFGSKSAAVGGKRELLKARATVSNVPSRSRKRKAAPCPDEKMNSCSAGKQRLLSATL